MRGGALRQWRRGAVLCWGGVSAAIAGCGSRTGLPQGEVCRISGETRACQDGCGVGLSLCVSGRWSTCAVPPRDEPCENPCGVGVRTCQAGEYGPCEVPVLEEACENTCGTGVLSCRDGAWGVCQVEPTLLPCASKCGTGEQPCVDGELGPCSAPQPLPPVLTATVRDFRDSHPDFERDGPSGHEPGIVLELLGSDDKPVYAKAEGSTLTTSGQLYFDQWYRDVPEINFSLPVDLPLLRSPTDDRLYVYRNSAFFPIDGQGFGNQGRQQNYHFTLEASASFIYRGGEIFRFTGDDDLWVFLNRRLVIDLGGPHQSLSRAVQLDAIADQVGMEPGGLYPLHLFFAERHTIDSNFNIETSIEGLGDCPP